MSVLFGVMLLVGCGASADSRSGMSGTVKLDGKPIEKGRITLRPLTAGQTAGALVENGTFSVATAPGLKPGDYRVEFTARRGTGVKYIDDGTGLEVEETEQYVPAKYNTQSEETVTVTANGENHFDFNLKNN